MTNLTDHDGLLVCDECAQPASACQCDMLEPTCCPGCGYATNLCVCPTTISYAVGPAAAVLGDGMHEYDVTLRGRFASESAVRQAWIDGELTNDPIVAVRLSTPTSAVLPFLAESFVQTCFEAMIDAATSFTCSEAEHVHALYAAVNGALADAFMKAHAAGDCDDTDLHECTESAPGWRHKRVPCSVCGEPCISEDGEDWYHAPEANDGGDHAAETWLD